MINTFGASMGACSVLGGFCGCIAWIAFRRVPITGEHRENPSLLEAPQVVSAAILFFLLQSLFVSSASANLRAMNRQAILAYGALFFLAAFASSLTAMWMLHRCISGTVAAKEESVAWSALGLPWLCVGGVMVGLASVFSAVLVRFTSLVSGFRHGRFDWAGRLLLILLFVPFCAVVGFLGMLGGPRPSSVIICPDREIELWRLLRLDGLLGSGVVAILTAFQSCFFCVFLCSFFRRCGGCSASGSQEEATEFKACAAREVAYSPVKEEGGHREVLKFENSTVRESPPGRRAGIIIVAVVWLVFGGCVCGILYTTRLEYIAQSGGGLGEAVLRNDLNLVRRLLSNGADVNCRMWWGYTPLMLAARAGNERMAILLIEKGAVWRRFSEDRFWEKHKCMILHGGGQPPRGVRRLIWRMHNELKLPVFVLVDNDPWGYYIYSVVKQGSINLAFESQRMAIPDARFIGMSSFDMERFDIPRAVSIKLTEQDVRRAREILNYPWFNKKKGRTYPWRNEINHMLKLGVKLELEALSNKDFSFITEHYLPKKLKDKQWLD